MKKEQIRGIPMGQKSQDGSHNYATEAPSWFAVCTYP